MYTVACSIKPKSQMGISYPPNLVHILILLGFAKKIKFLAVLEVTANLTSCLVEKYKGFEKFIKGNFFRYVFHFLHISKKSYPKTNHGVWMLRSRRSFQHQDRPNWNISYVYVICVIWHIMSYYDEWRKWRRNMTYFNLADLGV